MSEYLKILSRKSSWTPVAVDKGPVAEGSEDTLKRCLALRTLELPVKEMLQQGLERELPDDPGSSLPSVQIKTMRRSMIVLFSMLLMLTALTSELKGGRKNPPGLAQQSVTSDPQDGDT